MLAIGTSISLEKLIGAFMQPALIKHQNLRDAVSVTARIKKHVFLMVIHISFDCLNTPFQIHSLNIIQ
jgi:hypothetical protein